MKAELAVRAPEEPGESPHPYAGKAYAATMNHEAVQDWLRLRRRLLDMESAFTDLAIKVAAGQESEELLQQERQALEAARQLCTAAYQRAFPAQSSGTAKPVSAG